MARSGTGDMRTSQNAVPANFALSPVLLDQGMQARCVQRALAVAHEAEHVLARIRKGPPGRLGRKAALMILHGSKHPVSGASARRPILVYKAATYEGELLRITLPRTPVNMRACVKLRRPDRAAS